MEISKSREEGKLIYAIEGRIDTQTAPDLQDELDKDFEEIKETGGNVIDLTLDLGNVSYMSSAGLRTVLYTKKKIDSMTGSALHIINVQPAVMEIFDMTGFVDFLDLTPIS